MRHGFHRSVRLSRRLSSRVTWFCRASFIGVLLSGCAETTPLEPTNPTVSVAKPSAVPTLPTPIAAQAPVEQPAVDQSAEPVAQAVQPAQEPARASDEIAGKSEEAKPRKILGKTTQNVRDAQKEQAAGAKKVQPKITGQDPISISGSAYAAIVGRVEILQIKHTLDLYYNLNNRYPKNLQEFMKEVIKANGIRLAQLPYYQEYGYDAVNHELMILEYPDKRAAYESRGR